MRWLTAWFLLAGCVGSGESAKEDAGESGDTGTTSTSCTPLPFYPDADGDGFGDAGGEVLACTAPPGLIATAGDCDDRNANANPDQDERCNGYDDDCDGTADDDAVDVRTWHPDDDEDGYGDDNTEQVGCNAPMGWIETAGDCNDRRAHVNPDAEEQCNGWDDDCDGTIDDDAVDRVWAWPDVDGDGYGDENAAVLVCNVTSDLVEQGDDCDDTVAWTYPGAPEQCDGVQNDCSTAWTDDAGRASHITPDGTWTDLTALLGAGTPAAPAEVDLDRGVLRVCAGTWYVDLDLPSFFAFTLLGPDGPDVTVLDAGIPGEPIIQAFGPHMAWIEGFTLRGGSQGLYAGSVHHLLVRNVIIEGGETGLLATTFVPVSVTLEQVTVRGTSGRGVALDDEVIATATDLVVDGCGGGLELVDRAALTMTGGQLTANATTGDGGGARVVDSTLTLDGVRIEGNVADQGGGLSTLGSTVDVVGCDFVGNVPHDTWDGTTGATWGLGATFSCDPILGCL